MKKIELTRGYFALVDDEDFEELNKYSWHVQGYHPFLYAARRRLLHEGTGRDEAKMHRQIMGFPKGFMIDHANRNGLDNRKENLRLCNKTQNAQNKVFSKGRSKFKGIGWCSQRNKWRVMVTVDGKKKFYGYFHDDKLASEAYDYAALLHFGEFANLNFFLARAKYLCILNIVIADNLKKGLLTL